MVRRAGGWRGGVSRISRASLSPHAMSVASNALLRACSLLLCLVAGSRQLSIKEFVVPKAVLIGEKAELRCQYELQPGEHDTALFVKWWWRPVSSSQYGRKQIYQRIAGQKAESLHHNNKSSIDIHDHDTIVLTEVSPIDSGVYECEVSNIEEIRKTDKLIVYSEGTGPILAVSEIEDVEDGEKPNLLLIECQAESVAPEPILSVTVDGQNVNMTTVVEDDDNDGLYNIYANTTRPIDDKEPKEVVCEMFYSDDSIAHAPYVDTKTFVPAGCDMQSTTEMPEDTTQPETTPESLQNPSDDGVRLHYSWVLLATASIIAHLQTIL